MKVFVVMLDWSTTDSDNLDVEVFDTYTKAFDRFNELLENEKFTYGLDKYKHYYEIDEHIDSDGTNEFDCWWNIHHIDDWSIHSFLDLRVMEVQ